MTARTAPIGDVMTSTKKHAPLSKPATKPTTKALVVHGPGADDGFPVEIVPITSVKPYGKNPRKNAAAVETVARSLKENGWQQPIVVDEQMVVVVGHTRLLAALSLGLTRVPIKIMRGKTKAQIKAYRLMDNASGEKAEWDRPLLRDELQDLSSLDGFDMSLTGFDDAQLRALADDGGWDSDITNRVDQVAETDEGIPGKIVVTCEAIDTEPITRLITTALTGFPNVAIK